MRTLLKINLTQLRRSKNKMAYFGKAYLFVVWWVVAASLMTTLIKPEMKSAIEHIAPIIAILTPFALIIPDIIQKLIFKHDDTAMDAYIKTRPIKQQTWNRFLRVTQLWHGDNLFPPAVIIPVFFVLPFGWALLCVVLTYIISVINGIIVMEIKRGEGYAETGAMTRKRKAVGAKTIYNSIFDVQIKSILRSRRLLYPTFVLPLVFLFYTPIFCMDGMPEFFPAAFFPLMMTMPSMNIGQYGMGIEANFFSAIWTRPLGIYRFLTDKYKFYGMITLVYAIILIPIWLFAGLPIYRLFAYAIFVAGIGNLLILLEAHKCKSFDLFGKVFFNQQGTKAAWKASVFLAMFIGPLLSVGLVYLTGDIIAHSILAALGITGFVISKPVLRWVEKIFMNNRYKYMEKYAS